MRRSETGQHERFKCQVQTPLLIVPTAEAKLALRDHLGAAGLAAYREITLAAKGLEIAHLQFVFRAQTLAVCSRVRRDRLVEIELGLEAASPEECYHLRTDAGRRSVRPGESRDSPSFPHSIRMR